MCRQFVAMCRQYDACVESTSQHADSASQLEKHFATLKFYLKCLKAFSLSLIYKAIIFTKNHEKVINYQAKNVCENCKKLTAIKWCTLLEIMYMIAFFSYILVSLRDF